MDTKVEKETTASQETKYFVKLQVPSIAVTLIKQQGQWIDAIKLVRILYPDLGLLASRELVDLIWERN